MFASANGMLASLLLCFASGMNMLIELVCGPPGTRYVSCKVVRNAGMLCASCTMGLHESLDALL